MDDGLGPDEWAGGVVVAGDEAVDVAHQFTDAAERPALAIHKLANATFAAIRSRLLKVAARIGETASRVRVAFAAACPEAALLRDLVLVLCCRSP